jgi:hypothetical protein
MNLYSQISILLHFFRLTFSGKRTAVGHRPVEAPCTAGQVNGHATGQLDLLHTAHHGTAGAQGVTGRGCTKYEKLFLSVGKNVQQMGVLKNIKKINK